MATLSNLSQGVNDYVMTLGKAYIEEFKCNKDFRNNVKGTVTIDIKNNRAYNENIPLKSDYWLYLGGSDINKFQIGLSISLDYSLMCDIVNVDMNNKVFKINSMIDDMIDADGYLRVANQRIPFVGCLLNDNSSWMNYSEVPMDLLKSLENLYFNNLYIRYAGIYIIDIPSDKLYMIAGTYICKGMGTGYTGELVRKKQDAVSLKNKYIINNIASIVNILNMNIRYCILVRSMHNKCVYLHDAGGGYVDVMIL